jgi:hypothetical protein
MVEPEVAFNDSDANMRLQESFVSYIVARALERRQEELKELERDVAALERVTAPFPRISYTAAVAKLSQLGSDIAWGSDLGGDDETLLAKEYDRPVLVYNYPRQVKAFYMKENPEDPRTVLNNDCLAPEGYGEIIGGSQREDDYDKLVARIREQALDPEAYRWYLDLRRYGTFVHSGFGLGIERTVAWICGIQHIREAIAFPRQIHRLYPELPSSRAQRGICSASIEYRTSRSLAALGMTLARIRPPLDALDFVPQRVQHFQPRRIQIDPSLRAQCLDRLEAVPELAVGTVQRRPGVNSGLARQVDHGEEEIPDLIGEPLRRGLELPLHLRRLLAHFLQRAGDVGPVEPHRSGPLLQAVRLEQRRQGGDDPGKGPSLALAALDPLPGFRIAQLEEMGMAAAHLALQRLGDLVRSELAPLLRDHQLKREVEKEVAHLGPDGLRLRLTQGIVEFEYLLHQVGTERLPGLGAVPGASPAEVAHHRESTSKR